MTIDVKAGRLQSLHDLLPRAERRMQQHTQERIIPQIENDVQDLIAPYPGPVVYPFQFASDASRKFYFAHFRAPYMRTDSLKQAWTVSLSTTLNDGPLSRLGAFIRQKSIAGQILIVIGNSDPAAQYVYPPRQVPGHRNTGWNLDRVAEVVDRSTGYVYQEWPLAVYEAI